MYFYPALQEVYTPEEVPGHPVLRLVANSEQVLSQRYSRRLITMEKVARYDAAAAADHRRNVTLLTMDAVREDVALAGELRGPVVHSLPPAGKRRFRAKNW